MLCLLSLDFFNNLLNVFNRCKLFIVSVVVFVCVLLFFVEWMSVLYDAYISTYVRRASGIFLCMYFCNVVVVNLVWLFVLLFMCCVNVSSIVLLVKMFIVFFFVCVVVVFVTGAVLWFIFVFVDGGLRVVCVLVVCSVVVSCVFVFVWLILYESVVVCFWIGMFWCLYKVFFVFACMSVKLRCMD